MVSTLCTGAFGAEPRVNILLFTADDLGYEAVGCLNEGLPDLTPNLDRFARSGMLFEHGHTTTPICQPSRSVMATGRYGNTSGMMGFIHMKKEMPTVMQVLQDNGYLSGILGKVKHSTPDLEYEWNFEHDYRELGAGRSPQRYYDYSKEFFARSIQEEKPFYFMVNSHDPHRMFHNPDKPMRRAEAPSKLFLPEKVQVPSYLPDLPEVRLELSHYYNSVRRLDDTFGRVMQALEESGLAEQTLVLFLSDNGSAFPFAKANVYYASSRTPWFVRFPGVARAGSVEREHMVSAIDIFPTFLDAVGLPIPREVDGRSFLPLLKGEPQEGRDVVFKQVDYLIGGPARPMRAIEGNRFIYIFSPWSRKGAGYRNNNEGDTMKAMQAAAKNDAAIAERVRMFRDREIEEFYDLKNDPGCLDNLIENPEFASEVEAYRQRMKTWMEQTGDPALKMLNSRHSSEQLRNLIEAYPSKKSLKPEAQQ
jgi:N-sulfoglucosamine sulfohydrolase